MSIKKICYGFLSSILLQSFAQSPIVKLDLNMSGRPDSEVRDPDYVGWVASGSSSSVTDGGVTFKLSKDGGSGSDLRADYYKAGVQQPYYARLVCDGVKVDDGDAGARIKLEITGLSTGTHSLLTYHNGLSSQSCAPLDIYVNGSLVKNDLQMPLRATSTATAASHYITFNATAGQTTTISFRAETSSSASIKNVYLCGIELNTPNFLDQAKNPSPVDRDQHSADPGSITMSWDGASSAVSHRVYFGTSESAVLNATTNSAEYKGEQSATNYTEAGLKSSTVYFWRVDEVKSNGQVTKGNVWRFRPRRLAFPGAEGYGRYAVGGRGGKVVHVTNLNDSGAGSLRDAVENHTGPRTIVFDVAGMIALNSRLVVGDDHITIAGQTAPGKGICIRQAPMGFTGDDVIGRHIRLRLGAGRTYDGMGMTGANHSILDHCSISWTIDEAFSSRGGKNITLQRTLISEALNVANHQNYPAGTGHGYAASIGGDVGSFHHNLLAHCAGRNWSMAGGLDGNSYYAGRLDISNNVVYNWDNRTTDGGAHEVNFINNYYKRGPETRLTYSLTADHEHAGLGTQRYYVAGNVMPGVFDANNVERSRRMTGSVSWNTWVDAPFFPSHITMHSAEQAYVSVLSDVGANQPFFDEHDTRIVNETKNGTYTYTGSYSGTKGIIDHHNDVGGYENYPTESRPSNWDSDGDGMPDFWEAFLGTNVNSSSNDFSDSNGDLDGDGYTNLEEYLNWMAEPHYFNDGGSTVQIDLRTLYRGFNSPSYSFENVVNGTVSISGNTLTFTPNGCGLASFTLLASESGFTMRREIGVFTEAQNGSCTPIFYDCAGVEDGSATLDECGVCSGGTTGVEACSAAIQGEDFCEAIGVFEDKNTGFTSTGYLNFDNQAGASGKWNIYAENTATVEIGFRYANGGTAARSMTVSVNGTQQATFAAQPTASWTDWETESITLNVTKGVNTIELVATMADGGPNFDLFALNDEGLSEGSCTTDCNGVFGGSAFEDECGTCVGGNTGEEACTQDCEGNWGGTAYLDDCNRCVEGATGLSACFGSLEAENACSVDGIQSESDNDGFSGEGYVNTDNVLGASVSWKFNSESNQTAEITFVFANGGGTARDGKIYVNGIEQSDLLLPATSAWNDWQEATANLTFTTGYNEVVVEATTESGLANIDILYLSEGVTDAGCLVTGSEDFTDQQFIVYPNTTSGQVQWTSTEAWTLFNAVGVQLTSGEGASLDLSAYPSGLYMIKFNERTVRIVKK